MTVLTLVLLLLAALLFFLAIFPVQARFNLVAAGLLAWVLVPLTRLIASLD